MALSSWLEWRTPMHAQALVECCYNVVQALLYSAIVYTMVGFDHNFGAHCPVALGGQASLPVPPSCMHHAGMHTLH